MPVQARQRRSEKAKREDLRPEYNLAPLLQNGVQGKYATGYREGTILVLLAPDVAKAFPTEDAVNEALRLVIQVKKLPTGGKRAAAKT